MRQKIRMGSGPLVSRSGASPSGMIACKSHPVYGTWVRLKVTARRSVTEATARGSVTEATARMRVIKANARMSVIEVTARMSVIEVTAKMRVIKANARMSERMTGL